MKNRTKKMMFMTLVATIAVATLLMSRGLAAPLAMTSFPDGSVLADTIKNTVSNSTCPTSQAVYQLLNSSLSKGGTVDISSLMNSSAVKDLLNKANVTLKTTTCPKKATAAPSATATPKPTAAPTATVAPSATATPAPTATAKPTPAPTSTTSGSMTADESHMIALVNQDRANNGLKALTFDSSLRAGALAHSQDMAQNNYFSHTSPTQGDFSTRVKAAGIKYSAAGENIAEYSSVDQAEVAFMNSAGHRANILGDYTRVGIGIVNKNGTYYITQWFAK